MVRQPEDRPDPDGCPHRQLTRFEEQPVDDEKTVAVLVKTIDQFFEEVDPDDFESEDLAWTLVRAMKRASVDIPSD